MFKDLFSKFAFRSGFRTTEFAGAVFSGLIAILPALQGSGNPVLMAAGAIVGLLYNHGRFAKKIESVEPGFTDRPGWLTSEWFLTLMYMVSGVYGEFVHPDSDSQWLVLVGLVMTAIHTYYRGKLKQIFIQDSVVDRPFTEVLGDLFKKEKARSAVTGKPPLVASPVEVEVGGK